jgi:hypothetical protein
MVRRLTRLALAMKRPDDVIPHLRKPTHWKDGRSAKLLAESWFHANDFPLSVRRVLDQIEDLEGAKLIDGWLERETDLEDGLGEPTHTDLLALIKLQRELAVLGIEAKVDESFGPLVGEWLDAGGSTRVERLAGLCTLFRVNPTSVRDLRYQLLHRTAAVILEARRFFSDRGVLIIHSFCPNSTGLSDAKAFYQAIGLPGLDVGKLVGTSRFGGVDLSVGWVSDPVVAEATSRSMEHA